MNSPQPPDDEMDLPDALPAKGKLSRAILAAVALGLLVPALVVFGLETWWNGHHARGTLALDLERTTRLLAVSMRAPLWELSKGHADAVVEALAGDPRVVAIRIRESYSQTTFAQFQRGGTVAGETLSKEREVAFEGRQLGTVSVTMALDPYLEHASQHSLQSIGLLTVGSIGSLMIILLVLRRRLVGPIARLTRATHRLADAQLKLPIVAEHDDEVGHLARTMEQTRQRLEALFADLRRQRAEVDRLAAIVESSDDGIVGVTPDGTVTSWNPGAERLLGYRAADVVGQLAAFLLPAERHPRAREMLLEVIEGREVQHFETHYQHRDGSKVPISTSLSPIRDADGTIIGASLIARDISDRLRAEAALRDSEARAMALFRHGPLGIALIALSNQTLVDVNEAWLKLCGATREETIGRTLESMGSWTQPCREALASARFISEGSLRDIEMRVVDKQGQTRVCAVSSSLIVIGGERHSLSSFADITLQVQAREVLTNEQTRLAELVAARTIELEAARAEAERSAKVKSEFLANMSHEIRTPLNGVLGLAEVGAHEAPEGAQRQRLLRILDAGQLLLGVINDILDFSKIEAGKMMIEKVSIELACLLGKVVQPFEQRALDKGLRLRLEIDPELPVWLVTDPVRVTQIMVNLLSNAIKFSESGDVDIQVGRDGPMLVIAVRDTGIGMTGEQMTRLFDPFQQADGSITRRFGGTGLGLAISRRLVDLMDGRLDVVSEPGRGSCFTLRLPLQEGVPASPSVATRRGNRLAGLRVLAAEDNPINQIVLEELLGMEGAIAVVVESGAQALECLETEGPDAFAVVLMDIQMPGMDGFETTRRIRAIAPGLPVIGQTAHAMAEDRERGAACGMVDYLTKPLDPEAMVAAIRRHQVAGPVVV